jgi:hypothetical protein
MEQIQNEMRANQGKKMSLANRRAMELEAKHPQLSEYDNQPEPTEPMRGGGDAGLARVVGSGKRKMKKMEMMAEAMPEMSGGAKQGKMLATHLRKLHGDGFFQDFWKGFTSVLRPVAQVASVLPIPGVQQAAQLASGVLGGRAGKCEMCGYKKCRCSGGMMEMPMKGRPQPVKYGRPQDQDYYKEMMAKREMSGKGRAGAGRAGAGMAGAGNQVAHANTEGNRAGLAGQALGGQDLPPNSLAPRTYGNTPSAPASFARNTVGMGRAGAGMAGAGMAGASNGMMKMKKAKRPPTARGAMVSKLMKEQGMSLGEASRYIKENGLA